MKIIKLPKGKYGYEIIDKYKYYSVRAGNNLTILKNWIKWAKKNYPQQKFILIDSINNMKDKLSKIRMKAGYDNRYTVYATY